MQHITLNCHKYYSLQKSCYIAQNHVHPRKSQLKREVRSKRNEVLTLHARVVSTTYISRARIHCDSRAQCHSIYGPHLHIYGSVSFTQINVRVRLNFHGGDTRFSLHNAMHAFFRRDPLYLPFLSFLLYNYHDYNSSLCLT